MSCEGRIVRARQFHILSVDEISEVKKGPHLVIFSELGSLDVERSSEVFLFLIYNHHGRMWQLRVTQDSVLPIEVSSSLR